jgi:hypothetical protein
MGSTHLFRNDKGPLGTIPTWIVNFAFEIPYFAIDIFKCSGNGYSRCQSHEAESRRRRSGKSTNA